MTPYAPWLAALAPALPMLVGLLPQAARGAPARARARLAALAASVAAGVAVLTAVACAVWGQPLATPTLGDAGIGAAIYIDALTAVVLVLVSGVGAVVARYSVNYLDGDPRHGYFTRWLCLTLAAVQWLVLSGNLALSFAAWIATSAGLHQLLIYYPERQAAVLAARKKFVASRLGDGCLLAALILLHRATGTLAIADLLHAPGASLSGAGALIALTALLKSAQLPTHGWLTEVMETPTPVSALLHAGIINAGGFLVLRLWPLIAASPASLVLLLAVGGATAIVGSLALPEQTSVKARLAWSTIAQMGFMMMQLGLGAFAAALAHLVCHALYKAYAFLTAAGAAERGAPDPAGTAPRGAAVALVAGVVAAIALQRLAGQDMATTVLGSVAAIGVVQLLVRLAAPAAGGARWVYGAGLAALVVGAYAAVRVAAEWGFPGAPPPAAGAQRWLAAVLVAAFAALPLATWLRPQGWEVLKIHAATGFYGNVLLNRLVLAWWPAGASAERRS